MEDSDTHRMIDIVQFSNEMIKEIEFGYSGHGIKKSPSNRIMRRLKISDDRLDEFENKIAQELDREKEHISLLSRK